MTVLVLGAGVIGLTTAVTLAEANYTVRVLTAELPEDTTSAAAGASWGPWMVEPRSRVLPWAALTLRKLSELADVPGTGVRLVAGMDVSTVQHEPPDWFGLLPDVRPCVPEELPAGYAHGTRYTVPLLDMPVFLRYLSQRFKTAGGAIEVGTVLSLEEALSLAPVVLNCTGLGAHKLVQDDQLFPIRGQQLVVRNSGITEFLEADTGDSTDLIGIYPHGDQVVLSGTAESGNWSREPDLATAEGILTRCVAVQPLLRGAEVLGHRVGLRPTRLEIRLGEERTANGGRIVHNYGHGGAGVSLAWGCATEILTMLRAED